MMERLVTPRFTYTRIRNVPLETRVAPPISEW
jgi:hypothetical protein